MLFVGEECRGIGQYVDGLLFITVYGEKSGEKISFRAISSGSLYRMGYSRPYLLESRR